VGNGYSIPGLASAFSTVIRATRSDAKSDVGKGQSPVAKLASEGTSHQCTTFYTPEQPATYHLLDRDKQTLTELFTARPELKQYPLAPMHAVEGKSRDGLTLVSYLTLLADVEGDRPPEPLPMVLIVHDGPWARDIFGYRGDHQWLADRGTPSSPSIIVAPPVSERRSSRQVKKNTPARCIAT
jgi:dipeptidyl aminopeptidase/acylaminoacyl peptidase